MDNNTNAESNDFMRLIETLEEEDYSIVKAHLDGFDYAEIAEMVGISVAAVSMRLSRAKQKLRKMYEDEK
jgi:RNA polymerase sigma factor (sigma-70 family)